MYSSVLKKKLQIDRKLAQKLRFFKCCQKLNKLLLVTSFAKNQHQLSVPMLDVPRRKENHSIDHLYLHSSILENQIKATPKLLKATQNEALHFF